MARPRHAVGYRPSGAGAVTIGVLKAGLLALGLLLPLSACDEGQESTTVAEDEKAMIYRIYKLDRGQAVDLGTITFDAANVGILAASGTGAAVEALQRDWQEIAGIDSFRLKYHEETTDDKGKPLVVIKDREVSRADADYPRALMDHFSRRYGYMPSPAD